MPKRSPTETLKELHSHSKKDKNISWKVSKQVKNVTLLCEVLSQGKDKVHKELRETLIKTKL